MAVLSSPRPLWHSLALLACVGLLPLAIFGAFATQAAVSAQQRALENATLDLSRAVASAVQSELDATMATLNGLAGSQQLHGGDLRSFYDLARSAVAARPSWTGIELADAQGRLLFKTTFPLGSPEARVVDPDSLRLALRDRTPTVGGLRAGQLRGPAFAVRVPVLAQGQPRFVLTAAVTPQRLREILTRQRVPADWTISVFDASGQRVARTRNDDGNLGVFASSSLQALLVAGQSEGSGTTRTLEGIESVTGYTRLPGSQWVVAVGAPTSLLASAVSATRAYYIAGACVSLLACALLAVLVSRRISAHIAALVHSAQSLGRGAAVSRAPSAIRELDEVRQAMADASERLLSTQAHLREAVGRAVEANAAKDQFLRVLGHELRNPLAPISNAMHLLDMKSDAATARERTILRRQVDHLRKLVEDLMDASRISRGAIELIRRPLEIAELVRTAAEEFAHERALPPGQLQVETTGGSAWLEADAHRLKQCVWHLLSNAVRFGEGRTVRLRVTVEQGQARIVVADQGRGMAADVMERVFDAFYQLPQAEHRPEGGLGLGLAFVRAVARLHGGDVRADSAGAGLGSCFTLTLPLAAAPLADARQAALPDAATDDGLELPVLPEPSR